MSKINIKDIFGEIVLGDEYFKYKKELYDKLYDFVEKNQRNPDKCSKDPKEVELFFELTYWGIL